MATANYVFWGAITGDQISEGTRVLTAQNSQDQGRNYQVPEGFFCHRPQSRGNSDRSEHCYQEKPVLALDIAKLFCATFPVAHAFDHYGQMVEYLRMNGIVPPASRGGN